MHFIRIVGQIPPYQMISSPKRHITDMVTLEERAVSEVIEEMPEETLEVEVIGEIKTSGRL